MRHLFNLMCKQRTSSEIRLSLMGTDMCMRNSSSGVHRCWCKTVAERRTSGYPFCCLRWRRKMGKLFRQLHGLLADSTKGFFGCFEDSPSLVSQYQFSKPTAAWMLRLCSLQRVLAIRILQCSQSCKAHSLSVLRTARILQP